MFFSSEVDTSQLALEMESLPESKLDTLENVVPREVRLDYIQLGVCPVLSDQFQDISTAI